MKALNLMLKPILFTSLLVPLTPLGMLEGSETGGLVEGLNKFAFEMYAGLAESLDDNVFFSPWSLSSAFGMAWAGAQGASAAEMSEVFHWDPDPEVTHPAFQSEMTRLNSLEEAGKLQLRTANAIWPAAGMPVLESYQATVSTFYGAHAESLDYGADPEGSRLRINAWVSEKTAEKIPDLIPPDLLGPETAVVLTNAVYFKGAWQTLFDPEDTVPDQFINLQDEAIDIDMMQLREDLFFYEDETVTLVRLPYHDNRMEAVLITSSSGELADVEAQLSPESLQTWLAASAETGDVLVRLPRFEVREKRELSSLLREMGMPTAFSPGQADFSGIFGTQNLFLSKVLHEAVLQVREEGTEAAAATAIVIEVTSIRPKPTFNGNKPFLFLIRDTTSGNLLFIGRIASPEPLERATGNADPDEVRALFGAQAAQDANGWWEQTGIGRFSTTYWPWLEHEAFGWMLLETSASSKDAGFWLYTAETGWLYASPQTFPFLWSEHHGWLFFVEGSGQPAWLFRLNDSGWVRI